MIKIIRINLFIIFIIILLSGCSNFSSNPDSNNDSTLKILYPLSQDSIGAGKTPIKYSLSTPASLKFMELYIDGYFRGNFPPNQDGSQPVINFNFGSNFIGSSFSYYLIYYDKNETSLKSSEIFNVHVIETVNPPCAPYNLRLIKLSETEINLTWSDSSLKVDGYEIWKKLDFNSEYQLLMDVGSNVFNINDENLEPESIYSYKIRGYNQFGSSTFSQEINTAGVGSSGNLFPPTGLIASALGTEVVKLSWKDNSLNENYFTIERKKTEEDFISIGIVNHDITMFTDSLNGLIAGGEYYYRIKSYSNSDSAWSNEAFVQTYWYDLTRPANLQAIYLGEGNVALTWSDDDNTNTIFEIERKISIEEQFRRIALIPGNQNSYLDENLGLNQYYTYRIRSGDGVYYSLYSNEAMVYISTTKD